jgi:hypothetical protein
MRDRLSDHSTQMLGPEAKQVNESARIDFKPDPGNSAARHYRGASENVARVEMRTQLAIERASLVTLHLQPARRSSIPTKMSLMQAFCSDDVTSELSEGAAISWCSLDGSKWLKLWWRLICLSSKNFWRI